MAKIWLKIWLKVKENGTKKIKLAKMVAKEKEILVRTLDSLKLMENLVFHDIIITVMSSFEIFSACIIFYFSLDKRRLRFLSCYEILRTVTMTPECVLERYDQGFTMTTPNILAVKMNLLHAVGNIH